MRPYLTTILVLITFGAMAVSSRFGTQVDQISYLFSQATNQLASVILSHNPKSVTDIQAHYNSPVVPIVTPNLTTATKVRILLVPGHEPDYGGAEFQNLKERNMTVELAEDLQSFLDTNDHYKVFVTRDSYSWSPVFASYFQNNWADIVAWQKASSAEMAHQISIGLKTKSVAVVTHNRTRPDVGLRLYGITKWANENDIDITIHIHFNDDTEHPDGVPGKHSGFAIYIPEHQYFNSSTTKIIAETVYKRLAKYNPVSDMTAESKGIIEDPDLIAVGVNNTANSASMLIEYGYIYQPEFLNPDTQSIALKDLAYQTYLGLQDFFDATNSAALGYSYDTVALPHSWIHPINESAKNIQNQDIFALQTALISDGEYPPSHKSMNSCPRTGGFGQCTKDALNIFQKKFGIANEKGGIGEKTLQVLNQNFGTANI